LGCNRAFATTSAKAAPRSSGKFARNRLNRPCSGYWAKRRVLYGIGSLLSQEGDIGINPGGNSLIFDLDQYLDGM
jgi:hypothetical protein